LSRVAENVRVVGVGKVPLSKDANRCGMCEERINIRTKSQYNMKRSRGDLLTRNSKRQTVHSDVLVQDINPPTSTEERDRKAEIVILQERLKALDGPYDILQRKTIKRRMQELQSGIHSREWVGPDLPDPSAAAKKYKREKSGHPVGIVVESRLYPMPEPSTFRNVMPTRGSVEAKRWTDGKGHKQRYAVTNATGGLEVQSEDVRLCQRCQVPRLVDREGARVVCPRCGEYRIFATYMMEYHEQRDVPNGSLQRPKAPSHAHAHKFAQQYGRGHPQVPPEVLAAVRNHLDRNHCTDPSRATPTAIGKILKSLPEVPRVHRRAADRLSKEMRGEGVPEFTPQQLDKILRKREVISMIMPDHPVTNTTFLMRELARALGYSAARMFPKGKTPKIHSAMVRILTRGLVEKGHEATEEFKYLFPST